MTRSDICGNLLFVEQSVSLIRDGQGRPRLPSSSVVFSQSQSTPLPDKEFMVEGVILVISPVRGGGGVMKRIIS